MRKDSFEFYQDGMSNRTGEICFSQRSAITEGRLEVATLQAGDGLGNGTLGTNS